MKVISVCQLSVLKSSSSTRGSNNDKVTVPMRTFMSSLKMSGELLLWDVTVCHTFDTSCVVSRNETRCQSLSHLARSRRFCKSLGDVWEISDIRGASNLAKAFSTSSMCWSSRPWRFSMGNRLDWNIGDGFWGKPCVTCEIICPQRCM